MDKTQLSEKITALLDEKFKEEEFLDCYLVDIVLPANNKLHVFIDSDSGMTFRKCQRISRYLENFLDEEEWMGGEYVIEVSSPGIGRPLKLQRQFVKNIGRKIEIKVIDGQDGGMTGILIAATDEGITVEEKVRVKEGKKKVNKIIQTDFPYDKIKTAKIKVTF